MTPGMSCYTWLNQVICHRIVEGEDIVRLVVRVCWFFCFAALFLSASAFSGDQHPGGPLTEPPEPAPAGALQEKAPPWSSRANGSALQLTIDEAIATALASNPDMEMAAARILESQAMVKESRAAFWPSLQLYTEVLRADAPSVHAFKRLDQRQLPLVNFDFNEPGTFQNFESGMAARLNLFKGGGDLLGARMARNELKIRELDRDAVRNDLVASAIGAYFNVLAARDYVEIAEQSVKTVEAQLRNVRVRFEGGSALKSELLSMEVRLAQVREERIRAGNRHQLSLAALTHVLGLDGNPRLELSADSWTPPPIPPAIEGGLAVALDNRPELLRVREEAHSAQMGVDRERASYVPSVDLQLKAYVDDENMRYDADRGNWVAGVLMTWDVFTGFSTGARVDQARARLARIRAMDRKTLQAVELDVRQAYFLYSEARARLEVSRGAAAQAQEALRLVEIEYEKGSASIVRYLDAELSNNALRVAETAALYDFRRAHAEVARALGHFATH